MDQFFGSIYCWLEDFFGLPLADYLWGVSSPRQTSVMFIGIGLSMIVISLAIVVLYYYIVNHPRLNNWWGWTIFLGVNAAINFVVGWQWVLKDYYDGLMVKLDPATGKEIDLDIFPSDIIAFGVTNMINAMITFLVFSYIIKWWSTNCSRAPF
jgi:hypothetical protein